MNQFSNVGFLAKYIFGILKFQIETKMFLALLLSS